MLLNQFSYVFVVVFGVALLAFLAWRAKWSTPLLRIGFIFLLVLGAAAAWLVLRPRGTPAITSLIDAERLIGSGKPAVIEFYSEY